MRSRPGLFLAIALFTTAVMLAVWISRAVTGGRGASVPAGETKTVGGVAWRLDWMQLIEPDDGALKDTYLDVIDGAVYVIAQFTFEANEEVTICGGATIIGDARQWVAPSVIPIDESTDRWCQPTVGGTFQVVGTIPPLAVAEIQGIDINFGERTVRLLGSVR